MNAGMTKADRRFSSPSRHASSTGRMLIACARAARALSGVVRAAAGRPPS